jgi:hypothetical protein
MTQAQLTERRTTVLTSAFVAAAIAITITVSGLLIAPSLGFDPVSNPGSPTSDERLDRAEQAGLEWQDRYEQMYPTR